MTSAERVILFVFAGRKPNMELQLPFIRRILDTHPNAEYHVWYQPRNSIDKAYVNSIAGERITVRREFSDIPPGANPDAFMTIFRHYSQSEYQDCLFVKLDDDIVFIQTERFGSFLKAIETHPDYVMSANIVNNGACTPLEPRLWLQFKKMNLPLLNVHESNEFQAAAHQYFFRHSVKMLNQPIKLVPTEDWLSINFMGYDWQMGCQIVSKLGTMHPPFIAGREYRRPMVMRDEGRVNMLPRIIMRGFLAAHLTFAPQNATEEQLVRWRDSYRQLGERYLNSVPKCDDPEELPGLSPVSHRQGSYTPSQLAVVAATNAAAERWGPNNWRARAFRENDPTAGRYTP